MKTGNSLPGWIETRLNSAVLLRLVIQPKASRTQIVGLHGEPPRLKIRVAAPPVDGQANVELVRFLAKTLGCAKSQIEILRGTTGKQKNIEVTGVSVERVQTCLLNSK